MPFRRARSRALGHRFLLVLVAALGIALLAPAAQADDRFRPAAVELTLEPGESAQVDKRLRLDAAPASADIVLAIDTTGSMEEALLQAQAAAEQIVADVRRVIPDSRFAVVDVEDYGADDADDGLPHQAYLLRAPLTRDVAEIQAALDEMTPVGGEKDRAEAYNRAFYEAANDPALRYRDGAERFFIGLFDNVPQDPDQQRTYSRCNNSEYVDAGRDERVGTDDDLPTPTAIDALLGAEITLSIVSYPGRDGSKLGCHRQLARATGGDAVDGTDIGAPEQLADEIVGLVRASAATVNRVHLRVDPGCRLDVTFDPPFPAGPITAPTALTFTETISAPARIRPGTHTCTVTAVADGVTRAVQAIAVTVPEPEETETPTPSEPEETETPSEAPSETPSPTPSEAPSETPSPTPSPTPAPAPSPVPGPPGEQDLADTGAGLTRAAAVAVLLLLAAGIALTVSRRRPAGGGG